MQARKDLDITLPGSCGFTAYLDTLSGTFTSDFAVTPSGDKSIFGDGSCQIEVSSISGDLTLRKGA